MAERGRRGRKQAAASEGAGEGPGPDPEATGKFMYVLKNKHAMELRKAAVERSVEDGTYRPDASALLREILDAWMARKK